jgi:Flp pilus assembly protein TadG
MRPHASIFRVRGALRRRVRATSDQGSELIEFAVCAAVLFTLIFGIINLSIAVYSLNFVSEAAQQGTRYAMVRGSGCTGLTACPAKTSDIQSYVQSLAYPGIASKSIIVTTTYSAYPAGTSCTPSTTCNNPGNLVQVKVQYTYQLSAPFLPTKTLNFTSQSVAVISN